MRLLLTGGCGFIGHHFVEGIIKETTWDIVILDMLTYAGNLNRIADIKIFNGKYYESLFESEHAERVKIVYHNLKAPISETTHKMIGDIDYVWHLAAESHVDRSLEDSVPFAQSNVVGTAQLLEYLKRKQPNLKRFIYFSTDEVFGPAPEEMFYKEGDVCNPSNPYAATKEGAEALTKAFAFSHRMPCIITRTMNVFGERQHPEKFIPKTTRAILNKEPITIHGVPGTISSRCWIHARNACDAMVHLTKKGEVIEKRFQNSPAHGIYHIVGQERDVFYLANEISKIIRGKELDTKEVNFVDYHQTRPGHDRRYALNGSKLKEMGFEYKLTLEQSFGKMINWMIDPKNIKWLELKSKKS